MVPRTGLEPARVAPHAPQACASTSFATPAIKRIISKITGKNVAKYIIRGILLNFLPNHALFFRCQAPSNSDPREAKERRGLRLIP